MDRAASTRAAANGEYEGCLRLDMSRTQARYLRSLLAQDLAARGDNNPSLVDLGATLAALVDSTE